jgi:hypothetical protein
MIAAAMTLFRLGTADEGRAILAAEDDFTRALGDFDRSFRMRTTDPVNDADLRQFLGEQALDFTKDEAAIWEDVICAVARGARGIGRFLPAEVLVVKTSGREERDHAYTRANAIFLPASRVASWRGQRAIYLAAHELWHVVSRASAALRNATYALLGFTPITAVAPPAVDRLTNPDAHSLTHYLRFNDRAVIPLLTPKEPLVDAIKRTTVIGATRVSLLEIDPETQAVLGVAEASADWARQLGRNTNYTIHPEEVLADNHALLVRRRLDLATKVPDPSFLDAFEEAISGAE